MYAEWKQIDEKLIRGGELILDLEFLERYEEELEALNQGKVSTPYRLAPSYIQLLDAVRHLYQKPHRQLERFTRNLYRLVPYLPSADYSGLRKRILALDPDSYRALEEKQEPVAIIVDSTGVKVHRVGGWVEQKHGKKKQYVKLHFAVDIETNEVVAIEVSTDDMHDVKAFPGLVEEAKNRRRADCWLGEGTYYAGMIFEMLEALDDEAVIKPRRNSRMDTRSTTQRRAVEEFLDLGYEA
jgi:hypothetical protein